MDPHEFLQVIQSSIASKGQALSSGELCLTLNPRCISFLEGVFLEYEETGVFNEEVETSHADLVNLYSFFLRLPALLIQPTSPGAIEPKLDLSVFVGLTSLQMVDLSSPIVIPETLRNRLQHVAFRGMLHQTCSDVLPPGLAWPVLKRLDLSHNFLKTTEGSSINVTLTGLSTLNLSHNLLARIPQLEACLDLQKINLSFNKISDVTDAKLCLGGITYLSLQSNALVSTAGLQFLKALVGLDIRDNSITAWEDVYLLRRLPFLADLWLMGNPVCMTPTYRMDVFRTLLVQNEHRESTGLTLDGVGPTKKEAEDLTFMQLQKPVPATPPASSTPLAVSPVPSFMSAPVALHKKKKKSAVVTLEKEPFQKNPVKAQPATPNPQVFESSTPGGIKMEDEDQFAEKVKRLHEEGGSRWLVILDGLEKEESPSAKTHHRRKSSGSRTQTSPMKKKSQVTLVETPVVPSVTSESPNAPPTVEVEVVKPPEVALQQPEVVPDVVPEPAALGSSVVAAVAAAVTPLQQQQEEEVAPPEEIAPTKSPSAPHLKPRETVRLKLDDDPSASLLSRPIVSVLKKGKSIPVLSGFFEKKERESVIQQGVEGEFIVLRQNKVSGEYDLQRILLLNSSFIMEADVEKGETVVTLSTSDLCSVELIEFSDGSSDLGPAVKMEFSSCGQGLVSGEALTKSVYAWRMLDAADAQKLTGLCHKYLENNKKMSRTAWKCISCNHVFQATGGEQLECPSCHSGFVVNLAEEKKVQQENVTPGAPVELKTSTGSTSSASSTSTLLKSELMLRRDIEHGLDVFFKLRILEDTARESILCLFKSDVAIVSEKSPLADLEKPMWVLLTSERVYLLNQNLAQQNDHQAGCGFSMAQSFLLSSYARATVGLFMSWLRLDSSPPSTTHLLFATGAHAKTHKLMDFLHQAAPAMAIKHVGSICATSLQKSVLSGEDVVCYARVKVRRKSRRTVIFAGGWDTVPQSLILSKDAIVLCDEDAGRWFAHIGGSPSFTEQIKHKITDVQSLNHDGDSSVTMDFDAEMKNSASWSLEFASPHDKLLFLDSLSRRWSREMGGITLPETSLRIETLIGKK